MEKKLLRVESLPKTKDMTLFLILANILSLFHHYFPHGLVQMLETVQHNHFQKSFVLSLLFLQWQHGAGAKAVNYITPLPLDSQSFVIMIYGLTAGQNKKTHPVNFLLSTDSGNILPGPKGRTLLKGHALWSKTSVWILMLCVNSLILRCIVIAT